MKIRAAQWHLELLVTSNIAVTFDGIGDDGFEAITMGGNVSIPF